MRDAVYSPAAETGDDEGLINSSRLLRPSVEQMRSGAVPKEGVHWPGRAGCMATQAPEKGLRRRSLGQKMCYRARTHLGPSRSCVVLYCCIVLCCVVPGCARDLLFRCPRRRTMPDRKSRGSVSFCRVGCRALAGSWLPHHTHR